MMKITVEIVGFSGGKMFLTAKVREEAASSSEKVLIELQSAERKAGLAALDAALKAALL